MDFEFVMNHKQLEFSSKYTYWINKLRNKITRRWKFKFKTCKKELIEEIAYVTGIYERLSFFLIVLYYNKNLDVSPETAIK